MMKLDPKHIKAKMQALDELLKMSQDMESEDLDGSLKGIKKVTVASNDPEGLEEGLDKAKELVEGNEELSDKMHEDMEEMQPEDKMSLPESNEYSEDKLESEAVPMAAEVKKKKKHFSFID